MPEKKALMPYAVNPDFDRSSYVRERVEEYRCYFEKELTIVGQIDNQRLKCLCLFAHIDALAAESAMYKRKSKGADTFTNFVLSCNTRYAYLDKIEPVTLFYRVEDCIEKKVRYQGFPAELEVDINSYRWDHVRFSNIAEEDFTKQLIAYVSEKKGNACSGKILNEHRLISLLYRMRSKLAHEMSSPGMDSSFYNDHDIQEPYYCECGRAYVEDDNVVSDNVVELHIPYQFIENIFIDCYTHYLSECLRANRSPFSYNKMTRKHVLSWYDN